MAVTWKKGNEVWMMDNFSSPVWVGYITTPRKEQVKQFFAHSFRAPPVGRPLFLEPTPNISVTVASHEGRWTSDLVARESGKRLATSGAPPLGARAFIRKAEKVAAAPDTVFAIRLAARSYQIGMPAARQPKLRFHRQNRRSPVRLRQRL
jgi:hypothetical protein